MSKPKNSTAPLLIGGGLALAVVVVVALLGAWMLGAFDRKELNVSKAEEGVKQIITDPINGYGLENVGEVVCNNGKNPKAKKGKSFTCEVTVGSAKRTVKVVFEDDNGTYGVDRPR